MSSLKARLTAAGTDTSKGCGWTLNMAGGERFRVRRVARASEQAGQQIDQAAGFSVAVIVCG